MPDHGKLEEAEKTIARNQWVAVSFWGAPARTGVVVHRARKLGSVAPERHMVAADRPGGLSYIASRNQWVAANFRRGLKMRKAGESPCGHRTGNQRTRRSSKATVGRPLE